MAMDRLLYTLKSARSPRSPIHHSPAKVHPRVSATIRFYAKPPTSLSIHSSIIRCLPVNHCVEDRYYERYTETLVT